MQNEDGDNNENDNGQGFSPRLPAVIPPGRPPVAVLAGRPVLAHWVLIAVAALASGFGFVTATLWPFQNKVAAVVHPSGQGDAPKTADGAARPSAQGDPPRTADSAARPSAAPPPTTDPTAALSTAALSTTTPSTRITPAVGIDDDACYTGFATPQIVVSGPPTVLPAQAPASLGLQVDGAQDGALLVICGFAAKSLFSAGRSIDDKTWRMQVSDAASATLLPPPGFVGPMKLVVALLNPDMSLADRRAVYLQWLPQTPGAQAMPRIAEINGQLEEGKRLKAAGNLAGARTIFLGLAQSDSRAAFLLAETYDPISLAKHQLPPPDSDLEKARLWYRRSAERGSPEANARLERLANW
jgi:hypothetical protein